MSDKESAWDRQNRLIDIAVKEMMRERFELVERLKKIRDKKEQEECAELKGGDGFGGGSGWDMM